MHNITLDFSNPGLPQVIDVMQSDAQSRFIGITLYDGGVPYSAPSGAVYTVEYHGQGANNTGWYDTIQFSSGTRKAVVVSSSSPNVVTLELAEQALRVNGKVEVSLCVVNNTGYKLNTFPIICRVTGAPYVDPVAVRSYFYVTGLTSEQWLAYVTACQDAQKRAEDAAAKLVIDSTLTQEGQAADAKATGGAIREIKEDIDYTHGVDRRLVHIGSITQINSDYVEFLSGSYKIIFNFSNENKRMVALKKRNGYWVNQSNEFKQKLYSFEFTVDEPFEALILVQGVDINIKSTDVKEINLYIKDTANKFFDYFSYIENLSKNSLMENYKIESMQNGYYNKNNAFVSDFDYNSKRTGLIKIEDGDKYLYKGVGKYGAISVIWYYDVNETIIGSETHSSGSTYTIITPPSNAKYVRFFSFAAKKYDTVLSVMKYLDRDVTSGDIDRIREMNNSNVLYNKTWVVCGDSWTAGDFTGLSKEQYFDENYGVNKTYQYFVGKRNSMNIITDAIGGSTMAITKDYLNGIVQDKNYREPFSNIRYKNIEGIENADYITLMFGINDKYHSNIGTINDETNETFYGAWNAVLKYLITNYPNAKIGIIIYSGDISADIHQALIGISKNNGIPYLDLNSTEYPLIVNQCEDYDGAKQSIINIRNTQNFVSGNNNHPNVRAQEKFSFVIEDWMRGI